MSRTARALWTLGTGYGLSAVLLVTGVVSTPILLRLLGDERFGAFRSAQDWVAYVVLLDFGAGGAVQALLVRASARGDEALARALRAGVRRYAQLTLVMAALLATFVAAGPALIPVPEAMAGELRWGLVAAAAAVLWLPFAPLRSLMEVEQRGYVVSLLLFAQSLTTVGLSLLFAWHGWGLVGQFIAPLLGGVPLYAGLAWYAWPRLRAAAGGPEERAELNRLSVPMMLYSLAGRACFQSDAIIVSLVLGVAAVVPFGLTQRLLVLAQMYVVGVANASWAGLAQMQARGETERFNRRLIDLTRYTGAAALVFLVPVAAVNRPFVAAWVGEDRYAGHAVTALTALSLWLSAVTTLWGWPLIANGHVARAVPAMAAGAAVTVIGGLLLTGWLGLVGPPVAGLLGIAAGVGWHFPLRLRAECGTPLRPLFAAAAWPLLLAGPYGFALAALVPDGAGLSRWERIASVVAVAACGSAGAALLAWGLVFTAADRAEWLGRFGWARPARAEG